jgi:hypothetical protein
MTDPRNDQQLDELLDSLLSDYGAVEPRPGLEMRIRATLRARAAQQRRRWMVVFAASAAIVVLGVSIAGTLLLRPAAPRNVVVQKPSPEPVPVSAGTVPPLPRQKTTEVTHPRQAKLGEQSNTPILLQIANAIPAEDNLVFEHQKLYLTAAPQQEQEPVEEPQPSAPNVSIQHLDARPIEIKELSSAKDIGSER